MKEVALACPGCEELEERLSDAFETLRALPRFRTDVLLAPHLCTSNALVATPAAVKTALQGSGARKRYAVGD